MSAFYKIIKNSKLLQQSIQLTCLIGAILLLGTSLANAELSELTLGVLDKKNSWGAEILRALRSAILLIFGMLCFKAIKRRYRFAWMQLVSITTVSVLSYISYGVSSYIKTPDFSYFSTLTFFVIGIHIFSSIEFLRRLAIGEAINHLWDNLVYVVTLLGISLLMLTSIDAPLLASEILLFCWSVLIVLTIIGIMYQIIEKHATTELYLIGWIPAQIGLLIALGIGNSGTVISVIITIAAWSSVILAHGFMAYLTFIQHQNYYNHHQAFPDMPPPEPKDSVSFFINKAILRIQSQKQKIVLNQTAMDLLHISGNENTYSIQAFKGLVSKEYHDTVDKMFNQMLTSPAMIKFHAAEQLGFLQPIQYQVDLNNTDILFMYQAVQSLSEITDLAHKSNHDINTANLFQKHAMHKALYNDNRIERRQSSDLMSFINHSVYTIQKNEHKKGNFVILTLEVKHHDDWQIILGLEYAFQLMTQISETIRESLESFEDLCLKIFNGNNIGIMCYVSDGYDTELHRINEIIKQGFEAPLVINDYKIFVSFNSASTKILVSDIQENISDTALTQCFTKSIDFVCRTLSMNKKNVQLDPRNLILPEGSNLIGLSTDLRYAPERDQINAYYSPIIDLIKGDVIGFHIDPVWRHPDFSFVQGELLTYLTQRCNMENTVDRLLIGKSIEGMIKLYKAKKLPIMCFHISKNRLLSASVDEEIQNLCETLHINPSLIRLEFSADCLSENLKWFANILKDLKAIGVSTVLNDFGSTKGQLAALANLAFDRVIIDSSFSENIVHNERHFFALKSLTDMLNNMSIQADMKNVTSKVPLKLLHEAGISNISGHVAGTMMPSERALNLLSKTYAIQ